MKHVFIINPAAGKHDRTAAVTAEVALCCAGMDYEIAVSIAPGDCTRIARDAAKSGQPVRLYACGGDGTLNEVVNGAASHPNAAVTHYAGGSGNDFVRIFSEPTAFTHLPRLLDSQAAEFDLIQCGKHRALNVCSIGFDARIGTSVNRYTRLPFVTGSGAYVLSILVNLLRGVHEHYRITVDGQVFDGEYTLACIANGRYYGGGFYPLPEAQPDDGLLDVLLVRDVTRLKVAQVIGKYKAGQYRQLPDLIRYYRCKSITVEADRPVAVNLDGELLTLQKAAFAVAPEKIRFCVPQGLHWNSSVSQNQEKSGVYAR